MSLFMRDTWLGPSLAWNEECIFFSLSGRGKTKNGCVAGYKLFDVYDRKIYFQTANFVSMCIIKKETEIFSKNLTA